MQAPAPVKAAHRALHSRSGKVRKLERDLILAVAEQLKLERFAADGEDPYERGKAAT
jgi:hypothetical protein